MDMKAKRPSKLRDPLSDAEMQRRWSITQKAMKAAGIDALVIQGHTEFMGGYVRWFTDIPATHGYPRDILFPAEGLMTIAEITQFGAEQNLDGSDPEFRGVGRRVGTAGFPAMVGYTGRYDAELVANEIKRNSFKTVGMVNPAGMYYGFVDGVKSLAKDVKWVDATDMVDDLKAVKSAEEVDFLTRTAHMQDAIVDKILGFVKPGLKEYEVSAYARHQGELIGSTQGSFLCGSGPIGKPVRFGHPYQQTRELQKDDVFFMLVENSGVGGFFSHVSALMYLGKAPQQLHDLFGLAREAHDNTVKMLKPGASCADIFARHNAWMESHGQSKEKRIHCHGQGHEMVERPLIRHDETMSLREGMHLAVHPGVTDGKIHASSTECYIIGKDGALPGLHRTPKKVFELQ